MVLPPGAAARRAALAGLAVTVVEAPDWAEGMAASIRAGLAAVAERADAVVILLADMPEIERGDIDRLIAAFDPGEGREIVRAVARGRDAGASGAVRPALLRDARRPRGRPRRARRARAKPATSSSRSRPRGQRALIDLDTPEAWAAWRAARGEA